MDDARKYLRFLQELGVDEVPAAVLDEPAAAEPDAASEAEAGSVADQLASLQEQVHGCTACGLSAARTRAVFGEGDPASDLMFVGEGPGFDEDQQGRPFVGKAGQLLTRIIEAIDLNREDVYITNIVKCRPPRNRDPFPDEVAACRPYLEQQLKWIRPKVIVALGRHAAQTLLGTTESISRLRGRFQVWNGIHVMPTYHPAYLLRNPAGKRDVWQDVQQVRDFLKEHSDIYERTRRGRD